MEAQIGDYIELVSMHDDPDPIPVGTRGVVDFVSAVTSMGFTQYGVKWENGRTLLLVVPPDQFKHMTRQDIS